MKVNEFSKLIGIPDSKIRYYDRKGLISSDRKENNYRDYDMNDALNLYHAQMLRSFEMSVDDSVKAIGESFDTIDRHMEKTIENLETEIKRKQILLTRLKEIKKHFDLFQNEDSSVTVQYRPVTYNICHIGNKEKPHECVNETIETLASVMPFSYVAIKVTKQSIMNDGDDLDIRIGLGIIEENRELLKINLPDWVESTESGEVVYQYLNTKNPFELTKKDLLPLLQELKRRKIDITEDIVGRVHMSYMENDEFVHRVVLAYKIPEEKFDL